MSSISQPSGSPSSATVHNSRRSRAANKIINLAGLGGSKIGSSSSGSSGSTFPTFRFSPENEEIQEILSSSVTYLPEDGVGHEQGLVETGNGIEQGPPHSESLPPSPKPGETSPIKEYIRKNWTNKWDKKSLSLDLDLRGKIKTAIEDKRKSIVSHFIPEETGIAQSTTATIPEHTGETLSASQSDSNRVFTYDKTTQQVSSNITQNNPVKSQPYHATTEYEEIGIDFLACLEQEGRLDELLSYDSVEMANLEWNCPPASCVEKFEGVLASIDADPSSGFPPVQDEFIPFTTQGLNFGMKLLEHFLTKYFIGLLCAAILLPLNSFLAASITFICGILCTMVVSQTISQSESSLRGSSGESRSDTKKEDLGSLSSSPSSTSGNGVHKLVSPARTLQLSPKSQGWMLQFDDVYNPAVTTFHNTEPVFLRLDSATLYISSPKYQIPKRKLWNDPPFAHDIKFIRHLIFNLAGAQIFIAPRKLAGRRVWNKKYPIGIRLPIPSYSWQVSRITEPLASHPPSPTASFDTGNEPAPNGTATPTHSTITYYKSSISLVKGDKEFCRKNSAGKVIYLFSRTCREKEDWFRRLINAAKMNGGSGGSEEGDADATPVPDLQLDYLRYMENIIPNFENSLREGTEEEGHKRKSSTSIESEESATGSGNSPAEDLLDIESILTVPQSPMFLNAFIGRIFYDAVRSAHWSLQLQNKIQRKLNYLRRPPYVEVLLVKDLDLGGSFPIIQRASSPIIDSRGLWIDLDVTYEGNFCLTLETKINLMKLRKSPTAEEEPLSKLHTEGEGGGDEEDEMKGLNDDALIGTLYDSDADDSGESSEEEFDPEAFGKQFDEDCSSESGQPIPNSPPQPSKRGKLMRMVEKTSNFMSEMNFVKNAVGKFANTPLLLTVELKEGSGTIVLNLPSPPSNRLWIGFRTKPELKFVTTPKVGERQVNLSPLTDWIQKKIQQQIQRVLVLPNMDDITIPFMEFKLPS